jgi:ABC-2 type transport system permease protein
MSTSGPIADLSYRNVTDSPLRRGGNWWVIARQLMQRVVKLRSCWVLTVLSGGHYLILAAVTYFIDSFAANMGGADFAGQFFEQIVWKDQFLNGFQFGHFLLMAILLMVGAGAIANDNRSNALLVYFSKPCSKLDYLVGKFVGIFLMLAIAMLIPAVFFMFYGAMNFREHGFLTDDPMMIPRALAGIVAVCAFQASVILGVSSLFNQGRLAGATYAGIYVLSGVFAQLARLVAETRDVAGIQGVLDTIHYLSLYGASEGLLKTVLGTDGSFFVRDNQGAAEAIVPRPDLWLLLVMVILPVIACWGLALRKVRAVEVVS